LRQLHESVDIVSLPRFVPDLAYLCGAQLQDVLILDFVQFSELYAMNQDNSSPEIYMNRITRLIILLLKISQGIHEQSLETPIILMPMR
jgi:hypothetical protein